MSEALAITRILVALDTSARSLAALDTAAALASALSAELTGLFVEDINLLRLAELPFAREVGHASAANRPLEFSEVERALRGQAARIERAMAEAAGRLQLQWSFRVARGQVVPQILEVAEEVDLVVFGKEGRAAGPATHPGRPAIPAAGPVLVLFDGSAAAGQALAMAARLAQANGRPLNVLVPAETTEEFQQLRGIASETLRAGPSQVRYLALAGTDVAHLARTARREKCSAFVLASASLPPGQEEIGALLFAIGCPVVLVR
jgi:nucleotide-binding universal stress UspA family protein